MEERIKELNKMIFSLEKSLDSFEKDIIEKTTLREKAIRLICKYQNELNELIGDELK